MRKKGTSQKVRITISLPEDIDSRLEVLADRMGVTKAQACSMMIGQSVFSWEQTWGIFSDPAALGQLLGSLQNAVPNDNSLVQTFTKSVKEGERIADEVLNDK